MIKESIESAINKQINAELYSSYLYYSMEAWFESAGLPGFAHWMKIQAIEEMMHAHKFGGYIHARGGKVSLEAIAKPEETWESPLEVFTAIYNHEVHVSSLINNLVDIAMQEKDHTTNNFLQWFVTEQIEEESTADSIVAKLKLVANEKGGLFMIDRELAARTLVLPPNTLGPAA